MPFLKCKLWKLKLRLFLAGQSVAMVTYCVMKLIPTCSLVIGQFFDTMIVASSDNKVVMRNHQNLCLGKYWKLLWVKRNHWGKLYFGPGSRIARWGGCQCTECKQYIFCVTLWASWPHLVSSWPFSVPETSLPFRQDIDKMSLTVPVVEKKN